MRQKTMWLRAWERLCGSCLFLCGILVTAGLVDVGDYDRLIAGTLVLILGWVIIKSD